MSFSVRIIRPPDISREGLKFYPWTFFLSFLFYLSTSLSCSRAVDGHPIYFGGSVVGKASTIGIETSPTLSYFSQRVKKCDIYRRFQRHLTLSRSRLKMQQYTRTLKQTSCVRMIAVCPHQIWWDRVHAPLRTVYHSCPCTPKIARRKRAKSSITQPWIIRFHLNFYKV